MERKNERHYASFKEHLAHERLQQARDRWPDPAESTTRCCGTCEKAITAPAISHDEAVGILTCVFKPYLDAAGCDTSAVIDRAARSICDSAIACWCPDVAELVPYDDDAREYECYL